MSRPWASALALPFLFLAVLLSLAVGSATPPAAYTSPTPSTGIPQCDALIKAGLRDHLLLPGDDAYESRVKSWWSASSRLRPWCIVQPKSTEDVSAAIRTLGKLGEGAFAVRSGGHSHWAGGSNIDNGVTIDLGHFNKTTYHPGSKIASLGPAQRWGDVFKDLEEHGVIVPGGRDGDVGVGGLLTGGGNSYYTGRHGFVCDSLVNAEVVLADGRVVTANAHCHKDLWKALKGGLGNFGIVTRFDVQAFPAGKLWGGIRASDKSHTPAIVDALINFTNDNHKNPEAAFIINFTYQPDMSPDVIVAQVLVDTDGVADPPTFTEIQKVPELFNDIKNRTMSNIAETYLLPADLRNVWFTLTFKNDARVVQKSAELHEAFVADLLKIVPAKDLVTQSLWQPVPKMFADIGVAKGGNVMGLDQNKGNALLWLCAVSVKTAAHEAIVHRKAAAMTEALKEYAESLDAMESWIYVNYADPSQDALRSYGPDNIEFMRKVAAKYDPAGVFQKLVPGSFKVSRV